MDDCTCTHCKARFRPRLRWLIGQIAPRTHWTVYRNEGGHTVFCIWKMWLGRCYDVTEFALREDEARAWPAESALTEPQV